jgi:hypothetical protein
MQYHAWWENQGVAPCYRDYPLAFRLKGPEGCFIIKTPVDIRGWLPGDVFLDNEIYIPDGLPLGEYELQIAMLGKEADEPAIRFASAGREADGWYGLGRVEVQEDEEPQMFRHDLYYE